MNPEAQTIFDNILEKLYRYESLTNYEADFLRARRSYLNDQQRKKFSKILKNKNSLIKLLTNFKIFQATSSFIKNWGKFVENWKVSLNKNQGLIAFLALLITLATWLGYHDFIARNAENKDTLTIKEETIGNTGAGKSKIYEQLSKLYPNTNISNFVEVLGKPKITHSTIKTGEKEYIFLNKDFYLEAVADQDDNVLSFAITSRVKDFQPTFRRPDDYNNSAKYITLNKTTFFDMNPVGDLNSPRCFYTVGVRRFWYFEGYYEANPGNYQSFYVGINDAGYINKDIFNFLPSSEIQTQFYDENGCSKIPSNFREQATINTYLITAPFMFMPESTQSAELKLGVDLDEVRVINQ